MCRPVLGSCAVMQVLPCNFMHVWHVRACAGVPVLQETAAMLLHAGLACTGCAVLMRHTAHDGASMQFT
jgi:hypothetical protein